MMKDSSSTRRSITSAPGWPDLVMFREARTGNVGSSGVSVDSGESSTARSDVSGGLSRSEMEKVNLSLEGKDASTPHFRHVFVMLNALFIPKLSLERHLVRADLVAHFPHAVTRKLFEPLEFPPGHGGRRVLLVREFFRELGGERGIG